MEPRPIYKDISNPLERHRFLYRPPGTSKLILRMFGIAIPERYPDDDRKVIGYLQFLPDQVGMGCKCHCRGRVEAEVARRKHEALGEETEVVDRPGGKRLVQSLGSLLDP